MAKFWLRFIRVRCFRRTWFLLLLKKKENPYFGRTDFVYDGENEAEILYISLGGLQERACISNLTYGWIASISSMYIRPIIDEWKDVCMISVPSYGGRFPAVAVSRLQQMRGNGASAVLIVVYGNRDYDELCVSMLPVVPMNRTKKCLRNSPWQSVPEWKQVPCLPLKTSREPSLQRIRRRSHENRRPVKPVPDVDFARKRVRSKRSILPIRQRPIRKAVFPVCGALPYARRRQGASAVCCLQPASWNWKRPAVVIKWTNCFCHNNTDWTL